MGKRSRLSAQSAAPTAPTKNLIEVLNDTLNLHLSTIANELDGIERGNNQEDVAEAIGKLGRTLSDIDFENCDGALNDICKVLENDVITAIQSVSSEVSDLDATLSRVRDEMKNSNSYLDSIATSLHEIAKNLYNP